MFDVQEEQLICLAFEEYNKRLCKSLPSEVQLNAITFSQRFLKRMDRLIYHQKHFYYRMINTAAKRAACVVAAVFLFAAATTFSVEAFRETFVQFVVKTYEEFTALFFSGDFGEDRSSAVAITPKRPQYIPEGFELVAEVENEAFVQYVYQKASGQRLMFMQTALGELTIGIDTEGTDYKKIMIHDTIEALYYENKGENSITFTVDDSVFLLTIASPYTEEDLLKIVNSIPF